MPSALWEQVLLPWQARDGLLLSLAGSAPWTARRQICTLHDAAVFDVPEAYTGAFVAWYRALFRHLSTRACRLITVSEFSRERLALRLGVPTDRFAIIPNAAGHLADCVDDTSILQRLALEPGRYVLAVSSANPTKNRARLVEAFTRLPSALNLSLVLVGGRNHRVFADRGDATLPPQVVRTGTLTDTELVALYRHASCLAFPSTYEGFGLPPIEAMACRCPVLTSRSGALAEVCGPAALYVDAESVEALASAMTVLATDEGTRQRLIEAGIARVARYDWDRSARMLLQQVEGAF